MAVAMVQELQCIQGWLAEPARQAQLVLLLHGWIEERNVCKDFWHDSYHMLMIRGDRHFTGIGHTTAWDCIAKVADGHVQLSADKAHRAIEGLSWLSRFGHLPTDENCLQEVRVVQAGMRPRVKLSKEEIDLIRSLHKWCVVATNLYQVSPSAYNTHMSGPLSG